MRKCLSTEAGQVHAGQLQVVIDVPLPTEKSYHFVMPNGKLNQPAANEFYCWIVEQTVYAKNDSEIVDGLSHNS